MARLSPRHSFMHTLRAKALIFLVLAVTAAILMDVYVGQIAESNAYVGYMPIEIDFSYLMLTTLGILTVSLLMPTKFTRPSHFFVFSQCLFVLYPVVVFFPIGGSSDPIRFLSIFLILLFPVVVISTFSRAFPRLYFPKIYDLKEMSNFLVVVVGVVLVVTFVFAPSSAGFGLEDSYDRRIEGRETFTSNSVQAYLLAMSANGFVPTLGFLAGFCNKKSLMAIGLFANVALFYVVGTKSPFAMLMLSFLIGHLFRKNRTEQLFIYVILVIYLFLLMHYFERSLNDVSITAELVLRRIFMVPPHVVDRYFHFFESQGGWSLINGFKTELGITYHIGSLYFHGSESNVNTSTFLVFFASSGLFGYVGGILLVAIFFGIIDAMQRAVSAPVFMFLGFVYGLLIVEQAATTALVTSGIGVLAIMFMALKSERGRPSPRTMALQN